MTTSSLEASLRASLEQGVTAGVVSDAIIVAVLTPVRIVPRMPRPGWHIRGRMQRGRVAVRGRFGPAWPVRDAMAVTTGDDGPEAA